MLKVDNSDKKNLVIFYLSDNSGCSHVRIRFFADLINAKDTGLKAVILPVYTLDPIILASTKAIIWQKPSNMNQLRMIQRYKGLQQKFGYKLVYEVDDLFFKSPFKNESVPFYNPSHLRRTPKIEQDIEDGLAEIFPLFDTIMTSTDYLKKCIVQKYNLPNVVTVKNTVPRYLWSCDMKDPIEKDIEKPSILYSGASGHYFNGIPPRKPSKEEPNGYPGLPANPGDWDNGWREFIIKGVKDDKIDFKCMGDLPYFFAEIQNKIQFIPWTNSYNYPRRCWSTKADFQIAPLVENEFNKCKSALRFYESSIAGMAFCGTVFDNSSDSPYEEIHKDCQIKLSMTPEQIEERFKELCQKDKYNEIVSWQYKNLDSSGLILESSEAMNRFLSICDSNPEKLENI